MDGARCTLAADEAGRIMDRMAALEEIISAEAVEQAVLDAGLVAKRSCPLTPCVLLWMVIAMGLFTDKPLRQVFKACRRFQQPAETPTRSALCKGRKRLKTKAIRLLFQRVVILLCCAEVAGGFYKNLRLMGIDGSVYTTPDTPANEKAFGRPRGGSSANSQGGFPQVGKVSLVELGSHVELAFTIRPMSRGEPTMALRLLKHLTPGMLMLLDAGFFGYKLLTAIKETGAEILVNVSSTPLLKPIQELSDGSYLTKIHPTPYDRERDRNGVIVRVLPYTLNDPQRTGCGKEHRLVTTLLDEKEHPILTLIKLYHERWEHELVYNEQKTHQDPRRPTKPTHLRSETPAGVVQELYALSLIHFVVRKTMFDSARQEQVDPDRMSFTATIQILRNRLPECPRAATPSEIRQWHQHLLQEIAAEPPEPRRNRINPRVIKRARCKWPTKKPEHYKPPKLERIFEEIIVPAATEVTA
jgi:hypothetical protein